MRSFLFSLVIFGVLGKHAHANSSEKVSLAKACSELLLRSSDSSNSKAAEELVAFLTYAELMLLPKGQGDQELAAEISQLLVEMQKSPGNSSLDPKVNSYVDWIVKKLHDPTDTAENPISRIETADQSRASVLTAPEPEPLETGNDAKKTVSTNRWKQLTLAQINDAIKNDLSNTLEGQKIARELRASLAGKIVASESLTAIDIEIFRGLQMLEGPRLPWKSERVASGWLEIPVFNEWEQWGIEKVRVYYSIEDLLKHSHSHGYQIANREIFFSFLVKGFPGDERFQDLPVKITDHRVNRDAKGYGARLRGRMTHFRSHQKEIGRLKGTEKLIQSVTSFKWEKTADPFVVSFPQLRNLRSDEPIDLKIHIESNGTIDDIVRYLLSTAITARKEIKIVGRVADGARKSR